MEKEIWKTIPSFEKYEVSNLGNIKSLDYGRQKRQQILKPGLSTRGYLQVILKGKENYKTKAIHKLVAEVFLNHNPCGMIEVVNHKDFNKLNNKLNNLEVISQRENTNRKHLQSTSKYVGVYWVKNNNKWMAQITINKQRKYLGLFDNEEDAGKSYIKELKKNNLTTKIMSTENKLTAVEWLEQQTRTPEWHSLKRGDIFKQAKELEKQHIIDSCNTFGNLNGVDKEDFEQYYNETFKK